MRSRRGPRLVADRSPISRRPIADQSPTSFNDSHAPILTKLVGDRSATSRRLIWDWSATSPGPVCDQISRSIQKPGCDWFGRSEVPRLVADFSATSPGPIGDLVATSAIGGNCQSRRGRRAVVVYVWLGLYRIKQKIIKPSTTRGQIRLLMVRKKGSEILCNACYLIKA